MTTNDFRFEGYFGVKDGRKWKHRYCVFKQPNKLLDHFKLYLFKDRDDFEGRIKLSDITPFDDVLGYESGHHIDSDHRFCILMVGRRTIFFISFPDFDQMFEWDQKLSGVLNCDFFRLTLERVANNRSLPRQAGSLHIQRSRLSFVREPENAMSKIVLAWDVKEVKQCGIDPETRLFFIEAGNKAGKMRGKYFFSTVSSGVISVEKVHKTVSDTLNDRVLFQPNSATDRSPPTPAQPITPLYDNVVVNSLPRRRGSSNCHFPLPPPPLPPPPPPPPAEQDERFFDDSLPPPPPLPPSSSSPQAAIVNSNILETPDFPRRAARHSGSHECLQSRHEESLFPNATLQRPAKESSPGYSDCQRNPSLRHLTACDDDRRSSLRGDMFRRSNSLNIQSTKQDKSTTILQRIFKKRSRSETDFSGGSSSAGSTSGALAKETYRVPSVEPDGDDEVFDENPLCSSVPSSSPEGLPNSLSADVTLSPIREDRTPCGPGPSINSSRTRSVSATYTGSQGYRLSSTGSSGTGDNSTLKRNDNMNSGEENRSNCQSWYSNKLTKEPEYIQYPNNPFPDQRSISSTSQTSTLGYVTLPYPRKGAALQRSHSTVSGTSHSPAAAAATTTNVMAAKPRFGNEYVNRGTLRSVSQCTADSSSGGSSLSTTPAMACPLPADPISGGHRHYVNFPGIIPTGCESVAARTGYVNLDMRTSDDYAQVDLRRPGHSAPECPPPHLHYAKLHFHDSRPMGSPHTHHRLSNSADPCDYIDIDTSRTKALSKLVNKMNKSDEVSEAQTIPETVSLRRVSQEVHNSSSPPSGLNTSNNGANSSRNPSFRKIRNHFSNRKNSEATS